MDSKIGFQMNLIVVEAIRGRCASFTVLTATVSEMLINCVKEKSSLTSKVEQLRQPTLESYQAMTTIG